MKLTRRQRTLAILTAVGVLPIALMADSCGSSTAQNKSQAVIDQASQAAQDAVPYPLDAMKRSGWTERKLLTENLLRETDPNAIHYVYWLTMDGRLIAQYTIKGKVFDPNSQLTNTQSITYATTSSTPEVVDAPGDNGTWGPEPFCYGFFLTSGAEKKLPCQGLVEDSDTPETFSTPPILTYDVNQKSPIDKGNLAGMGGH
jgi:hypothetical protein